MWGEVSALVTAASWASSNTILKVQAGKGNPLSTNAFRCLAGALSLVFLLALLGRFSHLSQVWGTVLILLSVSTLAGIIMGDTIYIRALRLADLSILYPVSIAGYFLFTVLLAVLVLGETLTWREPLGGALILGGITLLVRPNPAPGASPEGRQLLGVVLTLLASLGWATSVILLRQALPNLDVIAANAVRLPLAALVLLSLASLGTRGLPLKAYSRGSLALIAIIGVLDFSAGGVFFLTAIKYAGAAKAAMLSSISPLFVLPLSLFVLRERVTRKVIMGTALTVAGVTAIFF